MSVLDNICDSKPTYASHIGEDFNQKILIETEARLRENSDNLTLPLDEEIALLHALANCELGKFLLQNKGLDGYWTQQVILGDHRSIQKNSLEYWMYHHAPALLATQERFAIFQQKTNALIKPNMVLASIPCGLMDDLLSLKYEDKESIKLIGIDLDQKSLIYAKENMIKYNKNINVEFMLENAWNLSVLEEYDVITSNGLTIYEPSNVKVIELYQKFFHALRQDGYLITSFLTPPPVLDPTSPWKDFSKENIIKQQAIFSDILQVKWQVFRTETQMRSQLEQVGFHVLDVIYDKQSMFPTIIAQK